MGTDLDAMLDAQRPDFVVNVAPPTAHHAITLNALRRGIAVLSEKPLAATLPRRSRWSRPPTRPSACSWSPRTGATCPS
jgi:hypothetical protein